MLESLSVQPSKYASLAKTLISILIVFGGTRTILSQAVAADVTAPLLWDAHHVPFSFTYNGKESASFLGTWQFSADTAAGANGQLHRYTYVDPVTQLKVTAEVRLYP